MRSGPDRCSSCGRLLRATTLALVPLLQLLAAGPLDAAGEGKQPCGAAVRGDALPSAASGYPCRASRIIGAAASGPSQLLDNLHNDRGGSASSGVRHPRPLLIGARAHGTRCPYAPAAGIQHPCLPRLRRGRPPPCAAEPPALASDERFIGWSGETYQPVSPLQH
jgi:hypothetical protein